VHQLLLNEVPGRLHRDSFCRDPTSAVQESLQGTGGTAGTGCEFELVLELSYIDIMALEHSSTEPDL
jgi:hypothetical protein